MRSKRSLIIFLIIIIFISVFYIVLNSTTHFVTYSDSVNKVNGEDVLSGRSGINDNQVIVDDEEKDYYYYMGLNYTANDGTLPSSINKNIYGDNNLVHVTINYSSEDINSGYKGYVSLNERQDTFIYYKVLPINDNGTTSLDDDYVLLELIDNPFTNRPNNKGFNGWTTDYSGAVITYDDNYYTRYVKIPVSYNSETPSSINITLHASWVTANVGYVSNGSWSTAFSKLYDKGMQEVVLTRKTYVYGDVDMTGYYYQVNFGIFDNCSGYYSNNGSYQYNCTCYRSSCTYYQRIEGENFDDSKTYYELKNNSMQKVNNSSIDRPIIEEITENNDDFKNDNIMMGYYKKITIPRGSSYSEYYDINGNTLTGNCNTNNGCEVYELIQYKDNSGNINKYEDGSNYYYLVTRDTNIIVMNGNTNNSWGSSYNKPFTLTSIYNETNYTDNVMWTVRSGSGYYAQGAPVNCYNDTTIENIKISYGSKFNNNDNGPTSSTSSNGTLYGRWNNVKIGRGIIRNGNYATFDSIIGGSNSTSGSSSNATKYKLIVESGFYNSMSLTNGEISSRNASYVEGKGVYGNDYDRVSGNNNNLIINYSASGSWGGVYYTSDPTFVGFDLTVKSGSFGSGKYDAYAGIYAGGRGNSNGKHYTSRSVKYEGGYTYNLIGGPITGNNRSNYNDTYLYIMGGEIDMVIGGAGKSATYGNRIIQHTGGIVNYSIFGGSNGYSASNGDGTVNGSSYIYVGGVSKVGKNSYVDGNDELYGALAGNVFGIGNGNSNYDTIGSSDNSIIIIDGNAEIKSNIYGGGNYASVGISSSNLTSTYTNIKLVGGNVYGNVYGGGNKNGSGSNNVSSSVNIDMYGGNVYGSIYGGSNQKGTIYGDVSVNIISGNVHGSIYGGGLGGYSSNNSGTYVRNNVNVTIGDSSRQDGPVIDNNVYGGSSFGGVNSINNNSTHTDYTTNVTVNKGTIKGSVFGGGQGNSEYTPNVNGNVFVTINDGTIKNVFGANDQKGMPLGSCTVVINGGNIENTFGGGNKTSLDVSDVTVNNGIIQNVFGGSNEEGVVTTSNVKINNGTIDNVYGGNNIGGSTTTSNVTTVMGTITNLYGGGKNADTTSSNVSITGGNINSVYGGGESANIFNGSLVNINGGNILDLYGGSNKEGEVKESKITGLSGTVNNIYGGNNAGGTTITTNVNINGTIVNNVYGGGNEASSTTSNVMVTSSTGQIENVYGGGNKASVTSTNVNINGSSIYSVYGGSNQSGDIDISTITIDTSTTDDNTNVSAEITWSVKETQSWQSTVYPSIATINVKLINNTNNPITTYNGNIFIKDSELYSNYSNTNLVSSNNNYSFNEANRYYGTNTIYSNNSYSFSFEVLTMQSVNDFTLSYLFSGSDSMGNNVESTSGIKIDYVYGGNNIGGSCDNSNVNIISGKIGNIYGGGNKAVVNNPKVNITGGNIINDVYGGGNQAKILTDTNLDVLGGNIGGSIYGGGNAGEVLGNTDIYISGASIDKSVYAGGNGMTATVYGNTLLNIDNSSVIRKHVFGGGNAAMTGKEDSNSSLSLLNIAGATISGNVYGGANTAAIYGIVKVNIGKNVVTKNNLIVSDIDIGGTVFGGGEANSSGSEIYDYSFISVTKGINIKIDASNHDKFKLHGSIFGSGNASSTSGYSYIDINNYGSYDNPEKNISIQRADKVTINNSAFILSGATDRTNEYSDVLFTLSRIKELKLKNNSILFLETGANLLEHFNSVVDIDGNEKLATVDIAEDGTVSKNVDNRLYMLEGKNLNVATNENVTSYGEISGMSFLGMYTYDRNKNPITAFYSPNYKSGDTVSGSELYYFTSGSYVLGMHEANHDINKNGFYSNFGSEDGSNKIEVKYIKPVPEDSNYYMWVIGEQIASYEINLIASKYLTLAAVELPLRNNYNPNSTFSIVGFNYDDLNSDISFVDEYDVPRIANSGDDADKIMGLSVKSGSGFITNSTTSFLTDNTNPIKGNIDYKRENTSIVPSLVFYLYHSKNLSTSGDMGFVTISLLVSTPIDDLNSEVERVNVVINLSRALYNTNDYEATIAPSKHYEMFATSDVNITNKSSFSTYYSLYLPSEVNPYKDGYHRSLVSSYLFPENTKITMIDLVSRNKVEYYYHVISEEDVNNSLNEFNNYGEVSYDFSSFVKMGSTTSENKYDDSVSNNIYYNSDSGFAHEEFIFIIDFSDTNITEDVLNESLLIELRNSDNRTVINVLGASQPSMFYNIYYDKTATIDVSGTLSETAIYPGSQINLNITTNFTEQYINSSKIVDSTFDNQKLGVKLSFYDESNNLVTGASLLGFSFTYEGKTYYPRLDGTTRINLASRVANVSSLIKVNTTSSLAPGSYKLVIESFGSYDGIYYGLTSSDTEIIPIKILNTLYGLSVDMDDKMMIIDKESGNNLLDNNNFVYKVNYDSTLDNPIVRISLYRRDYDSPYSLSYSKVDLLDYFTDSYREANVEKDYILLENPGTSTDIFMHFKDNLTTGTYKLVFSMYDGNKYIGDVYKYLIIK